MRGFIFAAVITALPFIPAVAYVLITGNPL